MSLTISKHVFIHSFLDEDSGPATKMKKTQSPPLRAHSSMSHTDLNTHKSNRITILRDQL